MAGNKVIISCAISGRVHAPTMSDACQTPRPIAQQSIDAAEACPSARCRRAHRRSRGVRPSSSGRTRPSS